MSETPNIDELRGHCEKLLGLLNAPEPGLATWQRAVRDKLHNVAAFLGYPLLSGPAIGIAGPAMPPEAERHLAGIKRNFLELVDAKYRRGQREHGGVLSEASETALAAAILDEAVDLVTYALALRAKMLARGERGWAR